jgi:hypothetical protein
MTITFDDGTSMYLSIRSYSKAAAVKLTDALRSKVPGYFHDDLLAAMLEAECGECGKNQTVVSLMRSLTAFSR